MIIYLSRTFSYRLIISGVAILMIGASLLNENYFLGRVFGILNSVLGLITIVLGSLSFLNFGTQIILNKTGFKDSKLLKEFITWDNIRKMELIYEGNHNKLLITLKQEIYLYASASLFVNAKYRKPVKEIKIDLNNYNINYSKLLAFLEERNRA